jgi:hypothetical protein
MAQPFSDGSDGRYFMFSCTPPFTADTTFALILEYVLKEPRLKVIGLNSDRCYLHVKSELEHDPRDTIEIVIRSPTKPVNDGMCQMIVHTYDAKWHDNIRSDRKYVRSENETDSIMYLNKYLQDEKVKSLRARSITYDIEMQILAKRMQIKERVMHSSEYFQDETNT